MPGFVGTRNSGRHGGPHQKARATALRALPYISACVRCGGPMRKDANDQHGNSALHYDHTDDGTGYLGFSHAACNLAVAQAKGGRVAGARYGWRKRKPLPPPPPAW